MKKITLTVIMAICISIAVQAQVTQEQLDNARKEVNEAKGKKEKKEKEKIFQSLLNSARAENALKAIESKDFVLEADRLVFKRGTSRYVNANTNFISLKGDKASVQIAFTGSRPGPNGIGGITLDGNVSNFEVKTNKHGNTLLSMYVVGAIISARVDLELIKDTHKAITTVTSNFSSNRFTLDGYIIPTSESDIFKGRSF